LKAYSGREFIRLLRQHGWTVERIEGSHHILSKPGREETISIPVHGNRTLKPGLIRHILKLADIPPE